MASRLLECFKSKNGLSINFKELPWEVIDQITECLPEVDQICLALSCRASWSHYQSWLRARNLKSYQLVLPESRPSLGHNIGSEDRPIVQLLRRLQDKRWKYCSGCWKLRRHSAWKIPTASSPEGPIPYKPKCMPFAETIDICPCLSMKFGEKLDLVKALRFTNTTAIRFSDKDLLRRLDSCSRHGSLRHVCSIDNHGLAKAQVLTNITWNDDIHTLRVDNTYTFQDKRTYTDILSTFKNREMDLLRIELSWHSIRTPFECPHKDPTRWLQRIEAGLTSHSLDPQST